MRRMNAIRSLTAASMAKPPSLAQEMASANFLIVRLAPKEWFGVARAGTEGLSSRNPYYVSIRLGARALAQTFGANVQEVDLGARDPSI